jgi:hypothetical protein
MKKVILILITLTIVCSCSDKKEEGMLLKATIEGIENGSKIFLYSKEIKDTLTIKDGYFEYKYVLSEPQMMDMLFENGNNCSFYVDNKELVFKTALQTRPNVTLDYSLSGSPVNDDFNYIYKRYHDLTIKYNLRALFEEYSRTKDENIEKKIIEVQDKITPEFNIIQDSFIKKNNKSFYSVVLVSQKVRGLSPENARKYVSLLDSSLYITPTIKKIRAEIEEDSKVDVSFEKFFKGSSHLDYIVDKNFKGNGYSETIYMCIMSDGTLIALRKDGEVLKIDGNGKMLKSFSSGLTSTASVVAVDDKDNLYILGTIIKEEELTNRGRTFTKKESVGVECRILDKDGRYLRSIELEGIRSATGVKIGENKLIVADTKGKKVCTYGLEGGKILSEITNLRTCCGILDFGIRDGEILVANLGAFRIDGFTFDGNQTVSFGRRGKEIDDFHGCCNPVSVDFLSNGGVISVEKDPTRIKVFSSEGAKKVEGIDDLVEGCAHIPIAVDEKDNIYLASDKNGIIKCVVKN